MINWSEITADGYSSYHNEVLLVFNFSFVSDELFKKNIQFIVGKIYYGKLHFPPDCSIYIKLDIRGQDLPEDISTKIRDAIFTHLEMINLKIKIRIDFLR